MTLKVEIPNSVVNDVLNLVIRNVWSANLKLDKKLAIQKWAVPLIRRYGNKKNK